MPSSLRLFLAFLVLTTASNVAVQAEVQFSQDLGYEVGHGEESKDDTTSRLSVDLEEDDDFVKFGEELWMAPIAGKTQPFKGIACMFVRERVVPPPES